MEKIDNFLLAFSDFLSVDGNEKELFQNKYLKDNNFVIMTSTSIGTSKSDFFAQHLTDIIGKNTIVVFENPEKEMLAFEEKIKALKEANFTEDMINPLITADYLTADSDIDRNIKRNEFLNKKYGKRKQ